jgi:RNA recognition motif-containing protein
MARECVFATPLHLGCITHDSHSSPFADDHRIFVGDLGKEVSDEVLIRAFAKYPGFLKAKVVRNSSNGQHKGYGFVSFVDIGTMVKALREMDGKYIGNRPCKLKKSTWQARDAGVAVMGPDKRVKTKEIAPAHKRRHVPTLHSGPPGAQ